MIIHVCNFCTYFICDNKQFWDNKYVRPVYNQTVLPLTHTLLTLHIKTFVSYRSLSAPLGCKPRMQLILLKSSFCVLMKKTEV